MARKSKKQTAAEVISAAAPAVEDFWVPIYSAKPDATIHLVALNSFVEGVYTHFHLNRTIPCIGKHSGCICKTVMLARRWKGYIGAWSLQDSRRVLAEITTDCYRSSPHLFTSSRDLRGQMIGLFRLGHSVNSPMRLVLGGKPPQDLLDNLPPPLPIQKCLWRIWGVPVT